MKFSHALILASSLAFFACGGDDDSPTAATPKYSSSSAKLGDGAESSSSNTDSSYDCSVSGGVKVVAPSLSEQFTLGQEITVIFGTDVDDNGYRITFKKNTSAEPIDLLDESYDAVMDGKTCNVVNVKLDPERGVEATLTGIIRVIPYVKTSKANNSALFVVKE